MNISINEGDANVREFPVLFQGNRDRMPDGRMGCTWTPLGCPKAVPWSLLVPHAAQAFKNHGQSLEMLASRGGLCPSEMVAVLRGERLRFRTFQTDIAAIPELLRLLSLHTPTEKL